MHGEKHDTSTALSSLSSRSMREGISIVNNGRFDMYLGPSLLKGPGWEEGNNEGPRVKERKTNSEWEHTMIVHTPKKNDNLSASLPALNSSMHAHVNKYLIQSHPEV